MKLNRHKPPSSLAFNMTPMIDIVFLLIIFFMTVSQITRTADVPLPLPRVTDGESDKINASITISLDKEGTIIIGSQKLSLAKAMTMVQTNLQKTDNDPRRVKIQIRCDRNCESRHVSELLTQLAKLG
ncbi:MAG: biopolymer transport protein ExbD, partial [Mariniblastus sp.]